MSPQPPKLLPETDYLLDRDKAAMGTVLTAYNGGDPLRDPPAFGYPEEMQVEIERRLILEQDRTTKMNQAIFTNPNSGWGQIKQFMDGVFEKYKAQNDSASIKRPRNQQEAIAQMEQMRAVQVDPNEVANIRQLAVKLDQEMKQFGTSFWTDPRTKNYADWLNRESGVGTAGFMQSGEQEVEMGVFGRTAYSAWQGVEGLASGPLALIHGGWDISRNAIQALGGPDIGPSYPTNYITADDGTLVSNGGKAPSMMDGLVMAYAHATGNNIQQFAADAGRAQEWELANREGLGGIVTSVSRLGGELVGIAPGMGATASLGEKALGTLTLKGLQQLGSLRLTKGLAASERGQKLIRAMSNGIGQVAGLAAYESITQGRVEGYGAAYMHGLTMAPVLITLGALGKKTEWFAKHRANMPAAAARAIGGAMEGAGFAGVETIVPDLLPSAWGFIRDPNQETWEAYAKNMLAFSLVKMATGRSTGVPPGIERGQLAERVARGEATMEDIAKAAVPDEAKLAELGKASMESRESPEASIRAEALRRVREFQAQFDVEEMGKGPAEAAVKDYQGPGRVEARMPTREELDALKAMPDGPEKRKAVIEAMGRQVQGFRKIAATGLKDIGELELQKQVRDLEALKEMQEAGDVSKSLLSGKHVDHFIKQREKALAELQEAKAKAKGEEANVPRGTFPIDLEMRGKGKLSQSAHDELNTWLEDKAQRDPAMADLRSKWLKGEPLSDAEQATLREQKQQLIGELREALRSKEHTNAELARYRAALKSLEADVPTGLEARRGDARSPTGERAGPQSLQVHPHRQMEPTEGVKPVSAADIFAEMSGRPGRKGWRIPFTAKRIGGSPGDYVKVPIRSGKIPGRSVLGVFKFFENLIRTKEGRDLAVASHEFSHKMHRQALGVGGKLVVKAAENQVAEAYRADRRIGEEMGIMLKDYPGSSQMPAWLMWMETWAEWHARNLLGEVGLDAKFPAISAYMRGFLASPSAATLRPQYERIQDMLYRYNAQGALERVRQSRVRGTDRPTETQKATRPGDVERTLSAVNKGFFDDMNELKKAQDRWLEASGRKPEDLSIIEDPARMHDALSMTADKTADYFVNHGIRLPGGEKVPGLRSVMESVKGAENDFQDYVLAIRNLDLYSKNKEIQLPPQDYVTAVAKLEQMHPEFPERLKSLKRWTDALVDWVAGAGNISTEDAQRIKDAYVVYVPFFRAIEGPRQHAGGRGVAEKGTGMSRIKGSTFEVKDPFIALQQVARSMIAKAHQNQVMTALYKMALGEEAGGLATVVPRTNVPKEHPLAKLLDLIEAKVEVPPDKANMVEDFFDTLREADALNPQTITLFSQKVIPTGERSIIAYTPRLSDEEMNLLVMKGAHPDSLKEQNNKLQWLEVDTKVYEALMGIDKMPQIPENLQPALKIVRGARDVIRFFATGIAPGFVVANLVRDALSRPLFDRQGKFRPFGGFVDLIRGAIEYHRKGEMRELYEELGVKASSFWTEGRQRELIGEEATLWRKANAFADRAQEWFSHPENYLRMAEFKDVYETAKREGKSEFEARMEALYAAREITVNFARAGVIARGMNQMIPYYNAGLQGQRKLWGQLLAGGWDTKGDANKARVQRGAILNGIANITVPATLLWLLNKDEEWYQDLPEWRRIGYFNMKVGDEIVSIPKPFEAGVLFGALPEIMLDHTFDGNPASMKEAMKAIGGPYLELSNLIPAILKPAFEVMTNKNTFTGRPLTPEWIERANIPQEQATFYTTEGAKIMSRALNGILTPIEIEALVGGYTAGAGTNVLRMLDEVAGLKDHPGITMNPMLRFTRQQVHGQSRAVDQLYDLSKRLDQAGDSLDFGEASLKRQVDTAKKQISELRRSYRAGTISREEAERRSYELAKPLVSQKR